MVSESCPPPKVSKPYFLEPVNVISYGRVFADVIKLRILRWENYSAHSKWMTILNAITNVLIREWQREFSQTYRGEGNVNMEQRQI